MRVFECHDHYSPRTGVHLGVQWAVGHDLICDYCGFYLNFTEDYEDISAVAIRPEMVLNIEEWYDEDRDFIPGKRVDIRDFYDNQPDFHFCVGCESRLMTEWAMHQWPKIKWKIDLPEFEESLFADKEIPKDYPYRFVDLISFARYRVIRAWLKKGKSPEALGLEFDQ